MSEPWEDDQDEDTRLFNDLQERLIDVEECLAEIHAVLRQFFDQDKSDREAASPSGLMMLVMSLMQVLERHPLGG